MTSKRQAQEQIAQLIEKYEKANKQGLNEANTRKDYILPLFAALGWRTDDSGEVAEEVRIGKLWADYAFKLGGITHFYLEAKAAGVDLEETRWAEQAVSYAYNKGVSWAVLTNFEGLKLFSADWDEREVNRLRVLDLHYSQYLEYFDDLWALSRENVSKDGLRTRFEHMGGAVRKRLRVDERLFGLLKEWRLKLIRLFVQYQPPDTPLRLGEIDEAVQRILDRLIFIRTVEDRRIEDPILSPIHHLRMKGQGKVSAWELLQETFRRLDDTYNSNLFARHLADELPGDESAFLPILSQLYSPDGAAFRFDFSAIEADVLGRVYEQYLGHVIETIKTPTKRGGSVSYGSGDQLYIPGLQPANRELVEAIAKQAKRKQQGIYYTPKYIVDYIVEQTLGRLLEERGGDRAFVESIAVLDPACGSGSFLIAAYDRLVKHYADVRQIAPEHLDQDERVEVLLRHIYGVDLDAQAVEIARLNLLLRALREPKLLPEMDKNIVRGNSLIGGDAETLETHFGPDWREVHPLNWEERFPKVMGRGGFDVVIGNPPYVRQELLSNMKGYFQEHYRIYHGTADLYAYFIERGNSLLRADGMYGVIVANKWMRANYGEPLRRWLKGQQIEEIVDFGDLPVFEDATTYPCILTIRNAAPNDSLNVTQVKTLNFIDLGDYAAKNRYVVRQAALDDKGWSLADEQTEALLAKLREAGVPLGEYVKRQIYRGVLTGLNEAFVIDAQTRTRLIEEDPKCEELIKPFLLGRDVKRYQPLQAERYLIFTRRGVDISQYPAIERHLRQFKERLMPKPEDWIDNNWQGRKPGMYEWYEVQDAIDYFGEFEKPKIVYAEIATKGQFTLDTNDLYCDTTAYILGSDSKYLLALLNSKLWTFMFSKTSSEIRGGFLRWKRQYMAPLPIRTINFSDPADVALHDRVVVHVEALMELHQRRQEATEHTEAWEEIGRQIGVEDAVLDRLVYELYGLTEEEIAIVEGQG